MSRDLALLRGTVRTLRPNSAAPYGIPWQRIADLAEPFARETKRYDLPFALLPAMAVLESDVTQYGPGGTPLERWDAFPQDGPSVGIMQVKPRLWADIEPKADWRTPAGNIRLGAALMRHFIDRRGSWQEAIVRDYFPTDDPNGTTQSAYVRTITSLMAEIANQLQDAPAPDPTPGTVDPVDPYSVIFGGRPYRVEYGFRADVGLNYYGYGVGHGTTAPTQHTGDDVLVPDETPLYAPFDGRVTCVGWNGEVTWGQGCGYFEDVDGGIGNITIRGEGKAAGYKVVLGHSSRAAVSYGDRVQAGQLVGYSGNMNGPHTHVEVAVEKNGTYWLVDPKPALAQAMGGEAPVAYAEPIGIPQPPEFEVSQTVTAMRDHIPVLQRANLDAPRTNKDLMRGDTFEAVYVVIGNDRNWYWVSTRGSRVPIEGTSPRPFSGETPAPANCGEVVEGALDIVEAARQEIDARLRQAITDVGTL